VLRLRGGPDGVELTVRDQPEQFESLTAMQMSGLSEHVVYDVAGTVSIRSNASAIVPIVSKTLPGDRVLQYDKKENEVALAKCIHLHNQSDLVLAPGNIAIFDGERFASQTQFCPMLPGDDQLIQYGEDGSTSVQTSQPSSRQSNELQYVRLIRSKEKDGVRGCELVYKSVCATLYCMQNHSTDRSVPKLYIDHTASTAHDGYVVTTTANCVKTATGFSRFEFSLAPQQQLEFEVLEEALYTSCLTSYNAVAAFLNDVAPKLVADDIIDETLVQALVEMLERNELLGILRKIENGVTVQLAEREKWAEKWATRLGACGTEIMATIGKKEQIEAVISEKRRLVQIERESISKISTIQERLRENIKGLEKVAADVLLARYLNDLNTQEDELHAANNKIDMYNEEIFKLEAELSSVKVHCRAQAKACTEALEALH
jgi:hypothetical protein